MPEPVAARMRRYRRRYARGQRVLRVPVSYYATIAALAVWLATLEAAVT